LESWLSGVILTAMTLTPMSGHHSPYRGSNAQPLGIIAEPSPGWNKNVDFQINRKIR
jgi:hypothetical protein